MTYGYEPPRLHTPVSEDDDSMGPADAPATLVEYGDFECPSCGAAYPIVRQVQEQMGDSLRLVWRNFPLSEIHPRAEMAAEAAEAAGAQGRFWEMHDLLFENQDALEEDDLLAYADDLELDTQRFEEELRDRRYEPRVREQFMGGVRSGVNGTPTFFVNGARYDGPVEVYSLVQALRDAGQLDRAA